MLEGIKSTGVRSEIRKSRCKSRNLETSTHDVCMARRETESQFKLGIPAIFNAPQTNQHSYQKDNFIRSRSKIIIRLCLVCVNLGSVI